LLRLLLPLRHKIWIDSSSHRVSGESVSPKFSPDVAIGRSDGRCVQRVVTKSTRVDDSRLLDIPRSRQIITIVYPNWWKDFKRFPIAPLAQRACHFHVRCAAARRALRRSARPATVTFYFFNSNARAFQNI